MKTIPLTKGYQAIIDDNILNEVSTYTWYCNVISGIPYGVTNKIINSFKREKILLHRFIYENAHGTLPRGVHIRFKDGNTLNCRLDNLYMVGMGNPIHKATKNNNAIKQKNTTTKQKVWVY